MDIYAVIQLNIKCFAPKANKFVYEYFCIGSSRWSINFHSFRRTAKRGDVKSELRKNLDAFLSYAEQFSREISSRWRNQGPFSDFARGAIQRKLEVSSIVGSAREWKSRLTEKKKYVLPERSQTQIPEGAKPLWQQNDTHLLSYQSLAFALLHTYTYIFSFFRHY